jgi:hypothetical protein
MPYKQQIYDYVIYKLVCNDESLCNEIYVGSTVDCANRKRCHKNVCNNLNGKHYNLKVYQIIRSNGGWQNWRMVPIKLIPNTTKREAEIREEELRVSLNATLNTHKAYQSEAEKKDYQYQYKQQYNTDNKDTISIKNLKYKTDNKNILSIKRKEKLTCKCGCLVVRIYLARHQKTTKCMKLIEKQNDQANMKEPPVI